MDMEQKERCLIVGCGYVGKPLAARLIASGWYVGGVVRSEDSAQALAGVGLEVIRGDIVEAGFWSGLTPDWDAVVYCPSTSGGGVQAYRNIHETGLSHAFDWLPFETRLFYTSSTSVYGQNDGEWVDESSAVEPLSESAQVLVGAERRVCEEGQTVLRLGGIYGPERGVLLKRLREGKALIPEQDPKWLNLIHLGDIIGSIEHALAGHLDTGEIYNVIDNAPSSYREIYQWLCDRLDLLLPASGTPDYFGKRGISNKRVSNQKLRQTGWQPQYPDFRAGYESELT